MQRFLAELCQTTSRCRGQCQTWFWEAVPQCAVSRESKLKKQMFFSVLGKTLASVAVSSALEKGLYNQMLYLIDEQKADPRITDTEGLDALHHLASNNIRRSEYNRRVNRNVSYSYTDPHFQRKMFQECNFN